MSLPPQVRVLNTPGDLFRAAEAEFAALATESVSSQGRFSVALSGGSTPKGLYTLLASGAAPSIPWEKTCFFWSDERHVPADHPDSNYRMANEAMLSKIPVRRENVFRVPSEQEDADAAAKAYERTLIEFFSLEPGQMPRFDLILLGLGSDGHTASLFPGTLALEEKNRLVVANWVQKLGAHRITFTYPVLDSAAWVMFLVNGADKSTIVGEVFKNPDANLPAQRVRPENGKLLWLLDAAAAGALGRRSA